MNTLGERLREVMQELDIKTPKALSEFCGVSEGLVSQWFSGQTKLGPKPLKAFARTHFSLDWIANGELPKYRDPRPLAKVVGLHDEDNHPDAVRIRKVKLHLSAGIAGFAVEHEEEDTSPIFFRLDWLASRGFKPESLIVLGVKGASMEPGLFDGDSVVVNTADTTPRDGDVFAVNYEGEAVIKRFVRDAGIWWLSSDNPDQRRYPRKECSGDTCIIIGKVIHKQSERI